MCSIDVVFIAAVAYHLAQKGLGNEVVLLEQDRLVDSLHFFWWYLKKFRFQLRIIFSFKCLNRIGGGMTWHSSGLVGAFKPSYSQVLLAQQTIKLYEELTAKGLKTGWKQCGSLNLARTRDRLTQFRRMKALSKYVICDILKISVLFKFFLFNFRLLRFD